MTKIISMPTMRMINRKCFVFTEPFYFYSDILKQWYEIPVGFETDLESIPVLRGTSPISGIIHDFLSRKDSIPVVTKKVAADVYLEFLEFRDTPLWKRQGKYWVVMVWPDYFHKFNVLDPVYSECM